MNLRCCARTLPLVLLSMLVVPGVAPAQAARGEVQIAPEARTVLLTALDSLERLSRHRDTVTWRVVRDSALALADGAEEVGDVYAAIHWALKRVDEHSFIAPPYGGARPRLLAGRLGYVRVPAYSGPAQAPLADSLQAAIGRFDRAGACGWIVDLRGNGGGNMWPMLAGIGPLLGARDVGAAMIGGAPHGWRYEQGAALEVAPDGTANANARIAVPPHSLRAPDAPVAVLIDGRTASSGEVMVVAFRGRPATRFFGQPTAGLSTVNRNVTIAPGLEMFVTVGEYADRTGRPYDGSIEPDDVIPEYVTRFPSPVDPVARRAAAWLLRKEGCRR